MSNISNKQKVTAIAAIGAAAVLGVLSFGNGAQAATHSYNCQTLNAYLGLSCCDRMIGSRLIDIDSDCHEHKKIVHKLRRRLPPPTITLTAIPFAIEREGGGNGGNGGNGGDNKGKGPNSLQ